MITKWEKEIIEEFCDRFCDGCDDPNVKCALVTAEFLRWMKEKIKEFAEAKLCTVDCVMQRGMNVKEIVTKHLKENGYDGLSNDECACKTGDLFPCSNIRWDCEANHLADCGSCEYLKGVECSVGYDWCMKEIVEGKEEESC